MNTRMRMGIDKGDVGGPSYPNVKKGVKTKTLNVFDEESAKDQKL